MCDTTLKRRGSLFSVSRERVTRLELNVGVIFLSNIIITPDTPGTKQHVSFM